MDCDGVLTDGRLWLTADGDEQRRPCSRRAGISFTKPGSEPSHVGGTRHERRAQEQIEILRQSIKDKVAVLNEILSKFREAS